MYDRLKSLSTFSLRSGQRVTIDCNTLDAEPVIKSALRMLTGDIRNVLSSDVCIVPKANIVVSQDASLFKGKNEAFRLEVKGGKLYVTGSDAHGVAYGLLEVSRLMGVSPWEWWADATPEQRQSSSLPDGFVSEQAPDEQATHPTFIDTPYLYKWNGTDCANGNYSPCEGLGYEGKAVRLGKERFLTYLFKSTQTDSIEVEVRLVPTHPLEGTTLRFTIVLDGNEPVAADYATQGRSEEWKTNVLWNQAVRRFKLPVKEKESCRLTLTALDEGIVVDQVIVKKSSKR